jgi:hypothetical protein
VSVFSQLTCCCVSAACYPARSISSSSAVSADEVAICVGRLSYKLANGEERHGFCSTWLTHLQQGARLRFKLVSQPSFRLPLNLAAPVVMVAAGTGLAPFRVSDADFGMCAGVSRGLAAPLVTAA